MQRGKRLNGANMLFVVIALAGKSRTSTVNLSNCPCSRSSIYHFVQLDGIVFLVSGSFGITADRDYYMLDHNI